MDEELHSLEKKSNMGNIFCTKKIRNQLVVNGYIRLNIIVMVPRNGKRLDWLPKGTPKPMISITMRPLHLS
jgi:hypothetical protein